MNIWGVKTKGREYDFVSQARQVNFQTRANSYR